MRYLLRYKSSKSGRMEYVSNAKTMCLAVKKVVDAAQKVGVTISDMAVTLHIEDKDRFDRDGNEIKYGGVQRYCESCHYAMAGHGVNNVWYCKKCIDCNSSTC